jgi:serine O-acetyltransferase
MKLFREAVYHILRLLTLLPHMLLFSISSNRWMIMQDLERWREFLHYERRLSSGKEALSYYEYRDFVRIMTGFPEFRSLFYHRIANQYPIAAYIMAKCLCAPQVTLYINTRNIGPGLFIAHGFSTIISAESIGSNCTIAQQVTIGMAGGEGPRHLPIIEDNVIILPGAIVVGGITIGSSSTVGANAVVVKNVPKNCTVVGVPAYIVRRNGLPTKENL